MKKLIAPLLALLLVSLTMDSYAGKPVRGKAKVNPDTKQVTCWDNTTDCYIINSDGTVEVQINGDWYGGNWILPSLTSNPGGTPLTYNDLPEVIQPGTINNEVDCPTCPPTDPEE